MGQKTVVSVDGKELKASDFADQLANQLKHLDALRTKDPVILQKAKENIVRDFIILMITENWARNHSILVKVEELEKETSLLRSRYPDVNTFNKMLAEQNLNLSEWKNQVKNNLLQKKVILALHANFKEPQEEELKSYYKTNKESFERPEQVKLKQIVLSTEADAKLVEDQLKKGKPLSELAVKYSITPEAKTAKGELGWVEKGVMDGFDQAFQMSVGSRSPIIKSAYGYHIFEVMGKRPAQIKPFEQVRTKISQLLLARNEQIAYTSWLEGELRKVRVLKDEQLLNLIKVETQGD
ncbi:MAG: peptidyl-prolyl cis-trans isomerase [Bdellovibrionales bacterium]|nr:peptidyl-prolyl cis-trans isomerase [Bdellovibrionales bacterium]